MSKLDIIRNYIESELYSEAIDLIADIENEYIESEEYWNLRGIVCLQMGAYDLSEEAFLNAISLNPINPDTNYNIATLYQLLECASDAALYYGMCYKYTKDELLKQELELIFNNENSSKEIFECAHSTKSKSFVILSNIPWSDIQQRVHHISKSLASYGNNVYFLEPKNDIQIESHPDIKNLALACSLEPTYQSNNLKAFKPMIVRDSATGEIQHDTYLDILNHLSDVNPNKELVLVAYHPDFIDIVNKFNRPHKLIYDCVDDHSDNEVAYWGGKDCILKEKEIMDKADYITTTATSLFIERAINQKRENVFLSKNAVSEKDFVLLDDEEPSDLVNIPHPRIVYSGFVYKRFDEKLFYDIVKANPDKSFIVIGPISKGLLEEEYPNLYLLSTKKHSELKRYLSHCDIGIVPHIEQCDMDIACDSIKQYEFLASGLDIITTFVPESVFDKINTYTASTVEEFNDRISAILNNKVEKDYSDIKGFLSLNSWNNRAALLCNLVDSKIIKEDFKYRLGTVRKTVSKASEMNSNPIVDTLNVMAMENSIEDKISLIRDIYSKSKERFIERYYLKLLLSKEVYDASIEVICKSKWVDKEVIEELRTLVDEDGSLSANSLIQVKKVLIALTSDDFILAKELVSRISSKDEKSVYNSYINLKLGYNLSNSEKEVIKKSKLTTPISKYLKNIVKELDILNKNTYIIGDESALSRTMLQRVNEKYSEATYYSLEDLKSKDKNIIYKNLKEKDANIIVLGDAHYVNIIRLLAENNIKECSISIIDNNEIVIVPVSKSLMSSMKDKAYKRNIVLLHAGAKDTNLFAIANLIPDKYKNKYNPILMPYENLKDKRISVLLPLITNITVSGHGSAYWSLPGYTYHIEVWHAGLSLKACGLMDPNDKDSGIGDIKLFQRANAFCVASHMDMMIKNSWFALSEDKYRIIGQPRTDYLFSSNGRKNLEKLLNIKLGDKTVILNMPTFHSFNVSGRVEGAADLNESIKIRNFDYIKFNEYLEKNNMVCVSKVHPREAEVVAQKMAKYEGALSNILFLTNEDIEKHDINIYEFLNGADILLTDYSSVYSDFMLLDRPVIFVNTDLEEYRSGRGISLEPYDFWTAGPKVQTQEGLHEELLLCKDKSYYKEQRDLLMPVFHKYVDDKATERFWDLIDELPITK